MKNHSSTEETLKTLVLFGLAFHKFNKNIEKELGLSLVQFHILNATLRSPGISAQTLANAAGVHPSTLTQTLKILIRKKLMIVNEHPRDSRMKIILCTRAGKSSIENFNKNIPSLLQEFTKKMKEIDAP